MKLARALGEMLKCASHFAGAGEIEATASTSWIAHEYEQRTVVPEPPCIGYELLCRRHKYKPYVELFTTTADGSRVVAIRQIIFSRTRRNDRTLTDTMGRMLERYGDKPVRIGSRGIPTHFRGPAAQKIAEHG